MKEAASKEACRQTTYEELGLRTLVEGSKETRTKGFLTQTCVQPLLHRTDFRGGVFVSLATNCITAILHGTASRLILGLTAWLGGDACLENSSQLCRTVCVCSLSSRLLHSTVLRCSFP